MVYIVEQDITGKVLGQHPNRLRIASRGNSGEDYRQSAIVFHQHIQPDRTRQPYARSKIGNCYYPAGAGEMNTIAL
jgi:hypothetical protein